MRVLLILVGDMWVTVWAIFPILAAAFSRNEVRFDSVCDQGCHAARCGLAALPSGWVGLLVV